MIHTGQFYVNLENEELEIIRNKYNFDLGRAIKNINNIYECIGIVINYITNTEYEKRLIYNVDFIKLLNKIDINETDIEDINFKINEFLSDIINADYKEKIMIRIDYRKDVVVNKENREILMYLYNKTASKYGFKKKYNEYDTTIYYNSKSIQSKVYDKEAERKNCREKIEDYEESILRFEVALRNQHLNYNKRKYGVKKDISNYLNNNLFANYMKNSLEVFLYNGDYYTIYGARKIISRSNLNDKVKDEIIEFLKYISKNWITGAKKKYSNYKFKKYINELEKLNINPILIPKNLKGIKAYVENPFKLCS
ncbi:hypothetical protein [Clostridium botulinum]|uniref:hypothetical protein n=1 Tax=Clostridium botulinum TaxID=1491 RepID=UPI0007748745|nr:hypothetical protein [Clostridium botulinum]